MDAARAAHRFGWDGSGGPIRPCEDAMPGTVGLDPWGRVLVVGSEAHTAGRPLIPPAPVVTHRSPKWPKFLADFLHAHPLCEGCGHRAATGHHVKPFHLFPDLELREDNIAAVCLPCHFCVCHANDWQLYVPTAREDLAAHLMRVRAAKKSP